MNQLTPIEQAIYDFMAWLTTRKEKLILSSADDASPAAQAVKEYLDNFILEDAITVNRAEYEQLKADADRLHTLMNMSGEMYAESIKHQFVGGLREFIDKHSKQVKQAIFDSMK